MMGLHKFRQIENVIFAVSERTRAVKEIRETDSSSESRSNLSGLDMNEQARSVHVTSISDRGKKDDHPKKMKLTDVARRKDQSDCNVITKRFTNCRSTKHDDLGLWKSLAFQKRGCKVIHSATVFWCDRRVEI